MNLKRNFGGATIPRYKLRAFLPVFSAFLTPTKIELKCEVSWYPQSLTVSLAVFFFYVSLELLIIIQLHVLIHYFLLQPLMFENIVMETLHTLREMVTHGAETERRKVTVLSYRRVN